MILQNKILFIANALHTLNTKSDTSLALAESALALGYKVYWCEKKDISYVGHGIFVSHLFIVQEINLENIHFSQVEETIPFHEFSCCFIRTDPPFDDSYRDMCWILNSQTQVPIYNSPASLLNFHEKSLHWRAQVEGFLKWEESIPTCVSNHVSVAKDFILKKEFSKQNKFIMKPWLGHGGESIQLLNSKEDVLQCIEKSLKNSLDHKFMLQPFLEEIIEVGDRRVLIAGGKIMCSFVRIPAQGKVASNLAQGGTAKLMTMSESQIKICEKLGAFLNKHSINFAGIDIIGNKIGEINITSPTGLRTYEALSGQKISSQVFKLIVNH